MLGSMSAKGTCAIEEQARDSCDYTRAGQLVDHSATMTSPASACGQAFAKNDPTVPFGAFDLHLKMDEPRE
jgi:hypothetical protein